VEGCKNPFRILPQIALAVALRLLDRRLKVQEEAAVHHQSQDGEEHQSHEENVQQKVP